jgi:hypothetical protein
VLPTSYTLSSHLLDIGPEPFAFGGFGDVYVGTLYGLRVRAKRIRMHPMRGPKEAEVSRLDVSFPGRLH